MSLQYNFVIQNKTKEKNMNNVNLSKSKYCSAKACFKKLWMSKYKREEAVQKARDAIFQNGTKVGQLAKGIFG